MTRVLEIEIVIVGIFSKLLIIRICAAVGRMRNPRASIKQTAVILLGLFLVIGAARTGYARQHFRFDRVVNTGSMLVPGPLLQDRDGFIWLGTQGAGLVKYDGYTLKRFPAGPGTFLDGNITALYEDRDGIIWFGTLGGLNSYSKDTDSFYAYPHNPEDAQSISHDAFNPSLQAILEDRAGRLWVGTQSGLNRYDKNRQRFQHFMHVPNNPDSLNSSNIFSVYEDRDGLLWVGTDKGLNRYDESKQTFTRFAHSEKNPESLSSGTVFAILEDRDGELWVGTSSGLNRFDRGRETFTRFVNDPDDPRSLPNNSIHSIFEDSAGLIWIGHSFQGSGLTVFDKHVNAFTRYTHDPRDPTTLSGDSVMGIHGSASGIIWLANLNGTLDKLDPESHKFEIYIHSPDDPYSISDNLVNVSVEDSEGTIWFSTNNGINRFNRETKHFTRYLSNPKEPQSIPGNFVCGPYEDSEKNLWVTSSDNYLSLFDKQKGAVAQTFKIVKFPLVVIEDQTDRRYLWITSWGNGLARFDKMTRTTRIFRHDPKDAQSISNNNLVDIYQAEDGIIWLPTMGGGLDLFDPRTGKKIKSYRHDADNPLSIGSDTVAHIFQDSTGVFWASTYGGGLNRFDKETESFERFTQKNGFPTNSVTHILEDDDRNLWIGSKIGYIRFNTRTRKTRVYTTADGLAGNEFQEAGIAKSRDGRFWLATITGANSFHPRDLKDNAFVPPVHLTSFRQGGVEIDAGMAPERINQINLDWRDNYFEFDFVALNYTNSGQNKYAYRLKGFEDDWNYVDTLRYGRYTNIPGGVYSLQLKGANNDGIWNEKGTAVALIVAAPPWKRWWAHCLYVGGVLLVLAVITFYIRRLRSEIADRRQAQQALQASEEKYRDLIEGAPDLRYRADREGNIVFISQSVYRLVGYTPEEALGLNMAETIYVDPKDREAFLALLRENGSVENFEVKCKRKDGSSWWASTNARFYKDAAGKVLGVEGVTRDVTELKLAQEKKEKLEERLKQAQKMESLGTLAGGIAHDFNNILSVIFGSSQLAKMHLNDPDKVSRHLGQINQGARKAADLVQQILTFSRKSQQAKLPLKIAPVTKEALKMLRSSIPATIEIREKIVSAATVIADPTKVHQVIVNLCTNAYHAMREDGGVLTVALDDVEIVHPDDVPSLNMVPGKYVRLAVRDSGHGMDEDVLAKIFEPYFTTKKQDEGTGLGLAVVLGIVQEHKGYTTVKSQLNEGTQFVVYLPITAKKGELTPSREKETLDVEGDETILVVDDEAEILTVTKVFLEQYGYRVVAFQDGVQALQAFEQDPDAFDLVITDMTMPKITGEKLAIRMMAIRPDLPVLLCTGYSHKISREEALRLGIRRYIEKPAVLKDLVLAVRKNLDGD